MAPHYKVIQGIPFVIIESVIIIFPDILYELLKDAPVSHIGYGIAVIISDHGDWHGNKLSVLYPPELVAIPLPEKIVGIITGIIRNLYRGSLGAARDDVHPRSVT